jgi:peptidoglycan/LPS O-acetylase OafA/YrhL
VGFCHDCPMRLKQLDGLRGVAALIVVVHHSLLLQPRLALAYLLPGANLGQPFNLAVYSPLHVLWDGPAAVKVFFVLSGFVLTLPFLRPDASWRAYYPSRLVRLYLPTIASVCLALGWVVAFPRLNAGSWWQASHAGPWAGEIAADLSLVLGTGMVNSPLWSLRWELWFSLLLPLYVWVGRRSGRWWPALILLAATASTVGGVADNQGLLASMPVFLIGVLLAAHRDEVSGLAARAPQVAVVAMCLVALAGSWWPVPSPWAGGVVTVGATVLVGSLLGDGPVSRALTTRPMAWLGRMSFSLYLVHEPLVVSLGTLGLQNPLVVLAISVPASLALAFAFHVVVERPSHQLAKLVAVRARAGSSA